MALELYKNTSYFPGMNMISSIAATCVWTMFYLSMIPSYNLATSSVIDGDVFDSGEIEKYDRIDEVNKECSFVLDPATELKRDENRLRSITDELSFENGDWWQNLNAAQLMPFDDSEILETNLTHRSPLNLVSFDITDVNSRFLSNKSIYIRSFMRIGITLWHSITERYYWGKPKFYIRPGHSQLSVNFQGIYTESENRGERVMCLLGTTLWPSRQLNSSLDETHLTKDDQILLMLQFPRKLTLTSRTIGGIMKSMNRKSNLRYFEDVHISSSWLNDYVTYEFASETPPQVTKACEPYPFKDRFINGDINNLYKGLNFCDLLKRFAHFVHFTILPNWKCNGTDVYCSKIGPFVLDKEINVRDFKLLIQDVRCDKMTFQDDDKTIGITKVFVMLRAVPPYEDEYAARQRTGVSNLTIFAEGIWKSSSGQLCMLGCHGDSNKCDTRICLYLPLSFSLNQQALILGTLSSTEHTSISHSYPLPFESQAQAISSDIFWDEYIHPRPIYEYSKIDDARVVLEKDNPFSLSNLMKKSLLGFPKIMDLQHFPYSLSVLANDLSFVFESDVALEIYFLGPLFGRYFSQKNISSFAKENYYNFDMDMYADKNLLLNVSGKLDLDPNLHTNLTSLSVEGIYDPLVGKLYLIGCQNTLDCLVEVVISYPPTSPRWLFKPRAWISITSKREKDDPFHSQPITFQSGPLTYEQGSGDILSRRGFEGILSILTLSLGITCILSQLRYTKEPAPYVSLVMLGIQAFGYALPLITGTGVIFRKMASDSHWQTGQWIRISDYVMKLLILAAFLLTLRLFHKVSKSRVRMVRQTPLEPEHVPNERSVHFATSASDSDQENGIESHMILQLMSELEEYMVLVQDLFLVPQIIANLLWKIDCKPLTRFYYGGMTFVRLVPHIYYLVEPGYFPETYEVFRPQFDFFHIYGDMAMVVTIVLPGFVTYVQQRWSYETLSEAFTGEHSKFKFA